MPDINDVLQDTLLLNASRAPGSTLVELVGPDPVRPTRPSPALDGPPDQPIWYWEYDPGQSLTRVRNLEVWARGMAEMHPGDPDKAWMTVVLEVNWQPVFVTVLRGANQFRISLPLTSAYVVRSYYLANGHNDGSNPWWPLEADVDSSFLIVFAYDIANKTSADLPDIVPAAVLSDPNFMPPPGIFNADPAHHYIMVCLSLVCCKERADFEPAGVLGAGRVYPHTMLLSSQPTLEAEAGVSIIRPDQSGYYGSFNNEPEGFRIMAHPDVDPVIGGLLATDTNKFYAADINNVANVPYWDLIFDYFLDDVSKPVVDAIGPVYTPGQPLKMVDRKLGRALVKGAVGVLDYSSFRNRILAAALSKLAGQLGINKALVEAIANTGLDVLLARPSLRLAIPQSFSYRAIHALLFGGDLHPPDFLKNGQRLRRDVTKVARQGAFDQRAHPERRPPGDGARNPARGKG